MARKTGWTWVIRLNRKRDANRPGRVGDVEAGSEPRPAYPATEDKAPGVATAISLENFADEHQHRAVDMRSAAVVDDAEGFGTNNPVDERNAQVSSQTTGFRILRGDLPNDQDGWADWRRLDQDRRRVGGAADETRDREQGDRGRHRDSRITKQRSFQ